MRCIPLSLLLTCPTPARRIPTLPRPGLPARQRHLPPRRQAQQHPHQRRAWHRQDLRSRQHEEARPQRAQRVLHLLTFLPRPRATARRRALLVRHRCVHVQLQYCSSHTADNWSAGCTIAEMFLQRPLFAGKHAHDQLARIMRVLGSPSTETLQELSVELKRPDLVEQECGFLPAKKMSDVRASCISSTVLTQLHRCCPSPRRPRPAPCYPSSLCTCRGGASPWPRRWPIRSSSSCGPLASRCPTANRCRLSSNSPMPVRPVPCTAAAAHHTAERQYLAPAVEPAKQVSMV